MKLYWMENGVYTYHGEQGRFAEALSKFREANPSLRVTAMAPIFTGSGGPHDPLIMHGYVVNTEEK